MQKAVPRQQHESRENSSTFEETCYSNNSDLRGCRKDVWAVYIGVIPGCEKGYVPKGIPRL